MSAKIEYFCNICEAADKRNVDNPGNVSIVGIRKNENMLEECDLVLTEMHICENCLSSFYSIYSKIRSEAIEDDAD